MRMVIIRNELDFDLLKTNQKVAKNLKNNVCAKVQIMYENSSKSAQEIEEIAQNEVKRLLEMKRSWAKPKTIPI